MATSMSNLYTYNPGTAPVSPAAPAQTSNANASTASSSNATGYLSQAKDAVAKTQSVDPTSLASNQLNEITKQDSPIMQRARQDGMLLAAKRGLQNSSIAAGAAQGAMVDRATPLAQQNSATLNTQALANQSAENETSQLNAQLGTSASQQNAALQTDVSKQNANNATDVSKANAALGTDVSKFNAGSATDVSKFNSETQARASEQNAAADNAMRQKVVEENSALNRQFLSGEQTMDLASIQGQYQQLISSNAAAAQLYDSYFQSISSTMANNQIDPARVAQTVAQQQQMLSSGLALIQNMGAMTFGSSGAPATPVAINNPAPPPIIGSGPKVTTPEAATGSLVNVGGRYGYTARA